MSERSTDAVPDRVPADGQLVPERSDAPRPAPLASEQLLQGRRMVEIAHNGEIYRLQATRLGKLILTK
jgi:hemin uptake protein HemP